MSYFQSPDQGHSSYNAYEFLKVSRSRIVSGNLLTDSEFLLIDLYIYYFIRWMIRTPDIKKLLVYDIRGIPIQNVINFSLHEVCSAYIYTDTIRARLQQLHRNTKILLFVIFKLNHKFRGMYILQDTTVVAG